MPAPLTRVLMEATIAIVFILQKKSKERMQGGADPSMDKVPRDV